MAIETSLKKWNKDLLSDEYIQDSVPQAVIAAGWLGLPPATEQEIADAELRLSARLPDSYREFLRLANGWVYNGSAMNFPGPLRTCDKICWFKDEEADWIDAWMENDPGIPVPDEEYLIYGEDQDSVVLRVEYLEYCLKISESSEGGVYLLNPKIISKSGEWEAWHFSNELPGATRSRSFGELIKQQHKLFKYYRDEE